MNVALDTNAYSDMVRGSPAIKALVENAHRVVLPFAVLAELQAGFAVGSKRVENEAVFERFLKKPHVEVIYADPGTIVHYAQLFRHLRLSGKMIPDNDLWIAAIVIQHNLQLRTNDGHFDYLPQIQRV